MQVLCKTTRDHAETCCSVCGQGFALYWERQTKSERAQALREINKTLRSHHYNQAGPEAHPDARVPGSGMERADRLLRSRHFGKCTQLGALKHLTFQD